MEGDQTSMSVKTILFDLDGTLLPMDQDIFVQSYFKRLAIKLAPLGYESKQLFDCIWKGTGAMILNDGSCLNEEAFWKVFAAIYGKDSLKDKPHFDAFYHNEFQQVQNDCGFNPAAAQCIRLFKSMGLRLALATNPIFPAVATQSRMRWAGLEESDFELYTTYENSRFCKPNLDYYQDILQQLGCDAQDCLMVGNDVSDDMVAEQLGMKVFLLTDCLINKEDVDISRYPNGSFDALIAYVKQHG